MSYVRCAVRDYGNPGRKETVVCSEETKMKKAITILMVAMMAVSASAAVRIIVEDVGGMVAIKYQTDGEVVRAFALDVTVDQGVIEDVNGFHRGESMPSDAPDPNTYYGIFPSAFAAAIDVNEDTGEVVDWNVADYTPLADPCNAPDDTLPGLGSNGVTLEFGALYSPPTDDSPNAPGPNGLLCLLKISEAATVSIVPNIIRGGIVLTDPTMPADVNLDGATAVVDPNPAP